jgi:Mitochondrial biogenesis AIM24
MVAFAAKVPGRIVPVDIAQGCHYYVHRQGLVCGTPGITPSAGVQQTFRGGLFGGEGFHLVALTGPGRVWLQSMPVASLAGALAPFFATTKETAGAGAMGSMIGGMLRS